MKSKYVIALLAVFIVAGSLAAAYATDASLGTFKFDVPNDYKVTQTNDTNVLLNHDKKEILITTDIVGENAINSYLTAKGFKVNETSDGTQKVTGTDVNGEYKYHSITYSKDKGYAVAYMLNRDNKNITVIGIDNDFDSDDAFGLSDLDDAVRDVVDHVMLRK